MQSDGSINFKNNSTTKDLVEGAFKKIPEENRDENIKRDISVEIEDRMPVEEEAANDAQKDLIKGGEVNNQKFKNLPKSTDKVLLTIQTHKILDFFPNKLIIDIDKVTIIHKVFFASEQIHSVKIGDISDVVVETSPFYSVLKIIDRGFTENSIDIHYLITDEALKARRIIQGLIIIKERGIDVTPFSTEEIGEKAEELGRSRES